MKDHEEDKPFSNKVAPHIMNGEVTHKKVKRSDISSSGETTPFCVGLFSPNRTFWIFASEFISVLGLFQISAFEYARNNEDTRIFLPFLWHLQINFVSVKSEILYFS